MLSTQLHRVTGELLQPLTSRISWGSSLVNPVTWFGMAAGAAQPTAKPEHYYRSLDLLCPKSQFQVPELTRAVQVPQDGTVSVL